MHEGKQLTRCFSAAASAASRRMRSASAECLASLSASLAAACSDSRREHYSTTMTRYPTNLSRRGLMHQHQYAHRAERPADQYNLTFRRRQQACGCGAQAQVIGSAARRPERT